jgi:hypothetical protein
VSIDPSPELSRADVACVVEERVRIANPGPTRVDAIGTHYGDRDDALVDASLTIDGRDARASLSRDDAIAIDTAVNTVGEGYAADEASNEHAVRFAFSVDPGAHAVLVFRATVNFRASQLREEWEMPEAYGAWIPARLERHAFVGVVPKRWEADLYPLVAPFRTLGVDAPVHVVVTPPVGWDVEGRFGSSADPSAPNAIASIGARTTTTFDLRTTDAPRIRLVSPLPPFWQASRGGPLLGFGISADPSGTNVPFTMRLGWELALTNSLFTSLTADTDYRHRVVVTPLVEVASPGIFVILPSFGFGLGLPVQLRPNARVGGRMQGDMHLGPLGAVVSIDRFVATQGEPAFTQITGLGEISF